jgi:single-strand DNA-binding protein
MSFHTIIIVGNLGHDPEMRAAQNGNMVTSMNVASNRQYTNGAGEKVKETTWFRVSVWGAQAESCNTYLKKGSSVLVEGELKPDKETGGPRVYESKGVHGANYEVTARTVRFLGGGSGQAQEPADELDMPF